MNISFTNLRFLGFVVLWIFTVAASPELKIQIQSGKLTVYAKGAPLSEVLVAITKQTGIMFKTIGEDRIPVDSVTEDFTDLLIDQGIARLLSKWDYALVKDQEADRLKEVYIFAQGKMGTDTSSHPANQFPPKVAGTVPRSVYADVAEVFGEGPDDDRIRLAIQQVKMANDPEEEAKALLNLQYFQDDQTLGVLRLALPSANPKIKLAVLETIFLREEKDPKILEDIRQLSKNDPDPEVREKALNIVQKLRPKINEQAQDTPFWIVLPK